MQIAQLKIKEPKFDDALVYVPLPFYQNIVALWTLQIQLVPMKITSILL